MHDIRKIRDNPAGFDQAIARRGHEPVAEKILGWDESLRAIKTKLQDLQAKRNDVSKQIGQAKSKGESADDLMAQVADIKGELQGLEEQERQQEDALKDFLSRLPNTLYDDVPDGQDESSNQVIGSWGEKAQFDFEPKQHFELGEALGMMDFERAAKISGSRFVFLKGALARLERAISQYMIDTVTQDFGFTEVAPPLLVRGDAMYGSGQLPKFEEDSFKTTTDHYLIPTAEVPLTNIFMNEVLAEDQLPAKFAAITPCFRSEAGAAGKDTRGMLRQHQFNKVEMVIIAHPDNSEDQHQHMVEVEESILQKLGLHYQKIILCAGDTGGVMHKTYDMEVWLPGQQAYREISSCSNAGEYQARRMNTRFKDADGKNQFVHSLNGSALAVGRTLIAVMETYQQADGSIKVPDVLKPYMNGVEVIS